MLVAVRDDRMAQADACRVIAIIGVILIHTAAPMFYSYRSIGLGDFLIANGLDAVARVSVPLFIMLSGALLLGRDVDDRYLSTIRRVTKVALPLLFWSLVYYSWVTYWGGGKFSIVSGVEQAFQGPVMYHLWFVYMIIGLYVILPILQVISVKMLKSDSFSIYVLLVWFLVNSVTIYYPVVLVNNLVLLGFFKWAGYFLLGFYIHRSERCRAIGVWFSAIVFILASLATFFISWWLNSRSPVPSETAFEYLSPNVLIASVAAFNMIMKVKISDHWRSPLAYLSGLTFPVYFMHLLVIELIKGGMFGFTVSFQSMSALPSILLLAILTVVLSFLLSAMARFIPFANRVVG
ncbi:hypothetical protein CMV24_09135 [Pseudomonas plecoglossicida]|uniref:Acyltransferase 3 domain-containing protein n=2 Tax=Pseudomonas TaxID=286 RepID=A0A2A3M7U0_PSEDL|nr:acyltransferase family protein [Pseudomonas plecoglossicida]PBJ95982.1 hypothetical protein CMV24_09135 [Pseudomonas plecoglossicida]